MKNFTTWASILAICFGMIVPQYSHAQTSACTFVSPAVELNYTNTDINGNCVVNVNLSFTININNGNKYTVLHLWAESQYPNPSFPYAVSNAPMSSTGGGNGALDNALATIIINRNTNPATFVSTYAIDPTIDDNTLPCINQVKDGADGLDLEVADVGNGNYFYLIKNLTLVYPGGCNQAIKFKGDAWSSNAASLNVQCTMLGFTYLSNVPTMDAVQLCQKGSQQAQYKFTVSTALPDYSVDYSVDVYADVDSSGDFNPFIDNVLIHSYPAASMPDVTMTDAYSVPFTVFNWSPTKNNNPLFFILGNIKVTNTITNQFTTYGNTIITTTAPDCSIVLPLDNVVISGKRDGNWIRLFWKVPTDDTRYAIEKMTEGSSTWKQIGIEKAKEGTETGGYEQYAYTDMEPQTALYRVRAFNPDGQYGYSNVIKLERNAAPMDLHIFPNPAPSTSVQMVADLPDGETANIAIINPLGQVVRQFNNVHGGTITLDDLSSGLYYIFMYSANKEKVCKTLAVK
ncbi:hypothetical protein D3C72_633960 [compost metagenome]